MKQPLIGFDAALLDEVSEVCQMNHGNVAAESQAVFDHEKAGHPAAAEHEGLVVFRQQIIPGQSVDGREAVRYLRHAGKKGGCEQQA
jgi:hypothetical protein